MLEGQEKPVHIPANPEKFEFDAEVSEIFDDMAVRSLPGYEEIYSTITDIVKLSEIPDFSQVWDIGTSTARGLLAVKEGAKSPYLDYKGCDVSEAMCEKAKAKAPWADIYCHDLRTGMPEDFSEPSIIIFGWTLQFLDDYALRAKLLNEAFTKLKKGGFLFVMEKFRVSGPIGEIMQKRYIEWRRDNGYTLKEIKLKNVALKGAMFPWRDIDLIRNVSFSNASINWINRTFNFGAVAIQKV